MHRTHRLHRVVVATLATLATVTGLLAATVTAAAPSPAAAPEGHIATVADAVAGEYIVTFRDGAVAGPRVDATATALASQHGGEVLFTYTAALVGFAASMTEPEALELSLDPRVAAVQENGEVHVTDTQTEPPSWGLDRIDQRDLPLDGSYTYANDEAGAGVTVYVIDTGIRTTHVDLGGRATVGTDTVGDGQNGQDCHGHGTHVAGTAAGTTYGVAKAAHLVAVRVLNCEGSGTDAQVIAGMDWVTANAQHPAVANMSLGGAADAATDTALANSVASGVTYAVAAGNGDFLGRPQDACQSSPARAPQALTVGAVDIADTRADFSNFGTCVDLFAPGVGITSSLGTSDTGVATWDGTSMATPHVVGVAARYLSLDPTATPAQVTEAVLGAATPDKVVDPGTGSPNRLLNAAYELPRPSITTVVDATPDAAKDFAFQLCPMTPTPGNCRSFSLDDDGNATLANRDRSARLAPGTYTLTQAPVDGWRLRAISCDTGEDVSRPDRRATITLAADEAVTCTFREGTSALAIVADSLPDAARDFQFRRCGPGPRPCVDFRLDDDTDPERSNRKLFSRLAPGTYTVTQAPAERWVLDDLRCDTGEQVDRAHRRVVVTIGRNEATTCTFTNSTTAITVVQDTRPGHPADFGFQVCRSGGSCRALLLDDDQDPTLANRTAVTGLSPGTYTIVQDPSHGPLTALDCDGGATTDLGGRQASITLAAGDRVTCTFTNTAPGPDNDFFADAATLTGPSGTVAGTTALSTLEAGEPAHTGDSTHSVWYTWTAPATGSVTFDTCDHSAYDTTLDVYSGSAVDALTVVGENDDACDILSSSVTLDVVAGTAYHVAVGGYHDDNGQFNLHWAVAP